MGHKSFLTVAVLPIPNMVFFPSANLPLFIEDARHIQMVKDCIAQGRLMAVSLIDAQSAQNRLRNSPRSVCTIGEPIIVESDEDGTFKVLLKGQARVKLLTLKQSLPYMLYSAEEIPDINLESDIHEDFGIGKLSQILKYWAQENIKDSSEREFFNKGIVSAKHVVDAISMYIVVDPEVRQLLLENVHLNERIQMLATLFNHNFQIEDSNIAEALKRFERLDKDSPQRKVAH